MTKGFGIDTVRDALGAGLVELGENYAQDLRAKADDLDAPQRAAVRWHFIGRLQTNKVRLIASDVALWQSVDRVELGRADREARARSRGPRASEHVGRGAEGRMHARRDRGGSSRAAASSAWSCTGSCASAPPRLPTRAATRSDV